MMMMKLIGAHAQTLVSRLLQSRVSEHRETNIPHSLSGGPSKGRGGNGYLGRSYRRGGFCCFSSERLEREWEGAEEVWPGNCYGEI